MMKMMEPESESDLAAPAQPQVEIVDDNNDGQKEDMDSVDKNKDESDAEEEDSNDESSVAKVNKWEATAMVINVYAGDPIVLLPAAFAFSGFSAAIIITAVAFVAALTAYQLIDGMQRAGTTDVYLYAEKASGRFGRRLMAVVYSLTFVLYNVWEQMLMYETVFGILDTVMVDYDHMFGHSLIIAIATVSTLFLIGVDVFYPTSAKWVGIIGTILTIILILSILSLSGIAIRENNVNGVEMQYDFFVQQTAFGAVIMATGNFAGAGNLPVIYERMKNPKEFRFVIIVSHVFFAAFYSLIGAVAYVAFGPEAGHYANVLQKMQINSHVEHMASIVFVLVVFYLKSALVQPIMIDVVFECFEQRLVDKIQEKLKATSNHATQRKVTRLALRSLYFILFVLPVSVVLNYFAGDNVLLALCAFSSAFFDMPVIFTFPSVMIILLLWKGRKRRKESRGVVAFNVVLLLISVLMTALGLQYFVTFVMDTNSVYNDDQSQTIAEVIIET